MESTKIESHERPWKVQEKESCKADILGNAKVG